MISCFCWIFPERDRGVKQKSETGRPGTSDKRPLARIGRRVGSFDGTQTCGHPFGRSCVNCNVLYSGFLFGTNRVEKDDGERFIL